MDANQTTALTEIKQLTSAIEGKLSIKLEHLDNAEARLSLLEAVAEAAKADPPVPTSQMEQMRKCFDDLEARGRRNNLRFRGFPEGCEDGSAVDFLGKILPELLGIEFPRGLIIERAHRTLALHQDGRPARAIIAKLLCFRDVSLIQQAVREKQDISWKGHKIGIFPDYTRAVETQHQKFRECKRWLHEQGVKFALVYPATLKVFSGKGSERRFDDLKKALDFINKL